MSFFSTNFFTSIFSKIWYNFFGYGNIFWNYGICADSARTKTGENMEQTIHAEKLEVCRKLVELCRAEAAKRLVGQAHVIDGILTAMLCGGAVLLTAFVLFFAAGVLIFAILR